MSTEEGGYAAAAAQRLRLTGVCHQLAKLAEQIGNTGAESVVSSILERMDTDAFYVMVVGDFKRGKSTFVNALLGAQVLPVKAVPATAVITEVRFGDSPAARLWREGAVAPESVAPERLIDLITVDNKKHDQRNPYVKAEVIWPLELCRNNVVLVDSPGLNDHVSRDEITLGYLRKADAVIFLQHAIAPMSSGETGFLESYLDAHDPFFVFTYFDAIDDHERDEVMASARHRITDLRGEERDAGRFFFVDGKTALRARIAEDAAAFRSSGVAALETALERYLATERHKAKVLAPARALRGLTRELGRNIPYELAMLDSRTGDLERRWEEAQQPLRALQAQARQITMDLDNQTRMLQDRVETLLGGFLTAVADEAPVVAADLTLTTKLGMNPVKLKERAEQVAGEIAAGTAKRIEEKVAQWVSGSLEPVITQDLEKLAERMNAELGSFEARLDQLRVDLTGVTNAAAAGERQQEPPLARFLAGVGGFVLGGVAGGMIGAQFGVKEALRTLLPTMAIAVVWLFTPFGLPTLITALVVQTIAQGNVAGSRLEASMREAVGREMATQIRLEAPKQARAAAKAFADTTMQPLVEAVTSGLSSRVEELNRSVAAARETRERGAEAVEQRRGELKQSEELLRRTGEDLDDVVKDLERM
ncbi:dynamin family protein [Streptomyces sp. NPDC046881]|uniref:dynamin family protein n=1 Tax=Streptomyces sp. NPDC046881 TaxID=3155374 RepID=UPI0033C363EF